MLSLTTCGKSVRLLALTIEEISYSWKKNVYINYCVFYGFWPLSYQEFSVSIWNIHLLKQLIQIYLNNILNRIMHGSLEKDVIFSHLRSFP